MATKLGCSKLWGANHKQICEFVLVAMRNNGRITMAQVKEITSSHNRMRECCLLGLFRRGTVGGVYYLNYEMLQQCAYIVPDDVYTELTTRPEPKPKPHSKVRQAQVKARRQQARAQNPVKVEDSELRTADILLPELPRNPNY